MQKRTTRTYGEYQEFLSFVFERYIRPRIARMRMHHIHRFEGGFPYQLSEAMRAAQLFRFAESYCHNDEDVYRTFTLERLSKAVSDTSTSLAFSHTLADEAGFLEACESHAEEIADGLAAAHLPKAEKELLKEMGSPNPEIELRSLIYRAKRRIERSGPQYGEAGLRQELRCAEKRLEQEDATMEGLWSDQRGGCVRNCEYSSAHPDMVLSAARPTAIGNFGGFRNTDGLHGRRRSTH